MLPTRGVFGPGRGPEPPGRGAPWLGLGRGRWLLTRTRTTRRGPRTGRGGCRTAVAPEPADAAGATDSWAGGLGAGGGPGRAAGPGSAGVSPVRAGAAVSLAAGACSLAAGLEIGRGPGRGPLPEGFAAGRADVDGPGRAPDLPFDGADLDVNDSRSRRATGASTVEDADFTNSPCSLSVASSSLLVTPSSLANSCTRALPATALLTERSSSAAVEGTGPARPRVISDGRSSLVLHGVLMSARACSRGTLQG